MAHASTDQPATPEERRQFLGMTLLGLAGSGSLAAASAPPTQAADDESNPARLKIRRK